MRHGRFLACLLLAFLAGCTALDPRVGAPQDTCGSEAEPGAMAAKPAYGATTSAASMATCTPVDGGSPCDLCESTYCCVTREACYKDPVCLCADQALDTCLGGLEDGMTAPTSAQLDACQDAFSARGTVEQARMACQQAWCAAACAAP
jgi:hypothetical protein